MNPEQRRTLADLLIQWEDLYRQGQDTPADVLCKDCPELAATLGRQIAALKRVAWLDKKLEDDGDDPANDLPDDTRPPRLLAGRYRLDELVATGGFAEVWRAFDLELQRIIAVKIPKQTVIGAADSFLAEARRVARLKHPAILPIHDVGIEDNECFFVSEYVDGGSLADRLLKGKLSPEQACRWIGSIADALDHAHSSGVIHRDIKPGNILIDAHDRALLADFGIAQSSMKSGAFAPSLGTLRYMAPEQLDGQEALPQSDIYSLGVVFHEVLTGKPPYSSGEPNTLRREIGTGAQVSRDAPNHLAPVLRKALHKDPGQRYGSAAEFATAIRSPRKQTPWLLPLGAAIAAAVVAFMALRADPPPPPAPSPPSLPDKNGALPPKPARSDDADRTRFVTQHNDPGATLEWLFAHQLGDGSWSFDLGECPSCKGRCTHSGTYPDRAGATALAVLAGLSRGHTHQTGRYEVDIAYAIRYLTDLASRNNGRLHAEGSHAYWVQAWGTLALSGCYAMTDDENLSGPAQLALNYIMLSQDPVEGGWPNAPGQPSNTFAVAWNLAAIHSGLLSGLEVAPVTMERARRYLKASATADKYDSPDAVSPDELPTFIAHMFCRMMTGFDKKTRPFPQGVSRLLANGYLPDIASSYLATQIIHQVDDKLEAEWNKSMRPSLARAEVLLGHEAGTYFDGTNAGMPFDGGRLYCSALATMTRQVYYRHMPIYRTDATPTPATTNRALSLRKPPPYNRRVWVARSPTQGVSFRFNDNGCRWSECDPSGKAVFEFCQIGITQDHIDLADYTRKVWIRLSDTQCEICDNPSFKITGIHMRGSWENANASPFPPALDALVTLQERRNTLERFLSQLSDKTGVPVLINNKALQFEGITTNQSFGLDVTDQPAREVLHQILTKADPNDRLRAVLRGTDDGSTAIEITTKQALGE